MKLEDIIDYIDNDGEFILFRGERIGVFTIGDIGYTNYLEEKISYIKVSDKRLVICLEY